ncbi:M14 family metallopeptidase [Paraburkholderia flagellata]|uniref:M14 family metallopeptidase n=1 Tax=Paraburkholderia flagellata TaxID=2883241 RepID=UPI001F22C5DD|nr:M14 family metallopeptidase [Paraburkholderia flagellata]
MDTSNVTRHFSGTYGEARRKFLKAADQQNAHLETFVLPDYKGAVGEELAIDVAYFGRMDASRILIVSSGTHGPEGFCGSGCQMAALHDADLMARVARSDIGLLMIHAINPYGFSHLQRTNQDNVDLNRNHINFDAALPQNAKYVQLDALVFPDTWPPSREAQLALDSRVAELGQAVATQALVTGQYSVPNGLLYGGQTPTWNNTTVRRILRKFTADASHIGWIDIHTGLGPFGHGDKLYGGRRRPDDLKLARAWWGALVFSPFENQEDTAEVSGLVVTSIYDECPGAVAALIGLEFGTWPEAEVMFRLRASQWLLRHPESDESQRQFIRQQLKDAFYCDNDVWKGMVWGQTRAAMLQALSGLADE